MTRLEHAVVGAVVFLALISSGCDGLGGATGDPGDGDAPAGQCLRPEDWECAKSAEGYCESYCDGDATKGLLFCVGDACYCGEGATGKEQCEGTFGGTLCDACEAATDEGCCGLRYP